MSVQATAKEKEYSRRIQAWTMYDWANSAFATTILAAVLPAYYSQVAGDTLPSAATATAYWSTGLSISLFIKKRFLSIFITIGVLATGLLVLVGSGDWLLASVLFVFGRIGFTAANVFYDALLPHVAREEDRDRVSTRGYAMGYLGGGLLLAINVAMIQFIPGTWGPRLSFVSVALWWAVFSIPLFRRIPEPPCAKADIDPVAQLFERWGLILRISIRRLRNTLRDIQQYRELFKFLIAFLIYNDGIGTIIGVAVIYGAELGFETVELILALLLVQFVGIPFSLIFGRLPSPNEKRRPFYLAFIVFNLIAIPLIGILGAQLLPGEISGASPPPYLDLNGSLGQGTYTTSEPEIEFSAGWDFLPYSASELGTSENQIYAQARRTDARLLIPFNGEEVEITYLLGPDSGIWEVDLDGDPLIDPETNAPYELDSYRPTTRFGEQITFMADQPGEHSLTLRNTDRTNPSSSGSLIGFGQFSVLPPARDSNLVAIIGMLLGVQAIGLLFAAITAKPLFSNWAESMDTQKSIILALAVYSVIAIWGYFLDAVVEFWFLAWLVSVVQGGSQALSRSLYASMSPSAKSGEFFGLFSIMAKFSAILGPLVFAFAVATFGSSRPAVLSIIAFFIIGGLLLTRVNIAHGRQLAKDEDQALMQASSE
jgi:UMF1 family MFS transporter